MTELPPAAQPSAAWRLHRLLYLTTAALLPAAPLMGMAAVNIALAAAVVLTLAEGRDAAATLRDTISPALVAAICSLVAIRLLSAALSIDPATSFRHCAKDWRMMGLFVGAAGFLARAPIKVVTAGFLAALAANVGWGIWLTSQIRWSYHWRTGSLLSHPMTEASVAVIAFFSTLVLTNTRVTRRMGYGLSFVALLLSNTKSTILGWMAGLLPHAAASKRPFWQQALALYGALGAMLLHPGIRMRVTQVFEQGLSTPSLHDRLDLWRVAARLGIEHPLGVGPGQYGRYAMHEIDGIGPLTHAHSNLFAFWSETGPLGLTLFLLFFVVLARRFWRPSTTAARTGLSLVLAFFVTGLAETNFFDGEPAIFWFVMIGHCLYLVARADEPWPSPSAEATA